MTRSSIFAASFILFLLSGCAQKTMTLEERLATLPAESIKEIEADSMFHKAYEIDFTQPVDHNNPDGPKFTQQVFLNYVGPDKPVVVVTEGYSARNGKTELADMLQCNQIIIEHRYFEDSRPDTIDWQYLTTWQAATDHHCIIEFFKPLFPGKWLTTGISKGGQTVMFHSYYYPDDVDVRVPYVGPLAFGPEDARMKPFLENVGTEECRKRIFDFQKLVLEKADILFPKMLKLAEEKAWTFGRVGGPEAAYEMTVLEYEFAFWQWGTLTCESIPLEGSDDEIFNHLARIGDFRYFADQGIEYFEPFFYQAMTELGYYGYDFDKFEGMLRYVRNTDMPEFLFSAPAGIEYIFNYETGRGVDNYLKSDAENFIFLYGEYDPWSAAAADPGSNDRCMVFIKEEGAHGTRIRNLATDQQEVVFSKLEEWLESPVVKKEK
ncbi:MAG: aminopeptidase [Bacteroidales bacterium]|nr:aminopeptidase [Bacteroidales bacterium]